ncbi:maltose O-acetyltransferas-like protein [Lentithecium fluviatile CBS 122367]|uniref:Maltose O-acetyltransferas-like protein n=1 Tax=Lentithecium fluviatile CBS 122367 TaxID=1168545 RepID=A0A6G1IIT6_9PLEO|nr:maltose O-acetyltransferas-like protein [Lentithecium fluviatile CBS 122367]
MELSDNKRNMLRGELYHAFTPELVADRARCKHACTRYNNAGDVSRRKLTELFRDILRDETPLPPPAATPEEDDQLFEDDPWIEPPVNMDYGFNVKLGKNVFINFHAVFLDTCLISVGSRTLVGPNVSFFSGTHPLDPVIRQGTRGPELGKEIHIGEDCWIGGNVVILPGVNIGNGSVVGAGSVVTKDVPNFTVVAGNPAKIIRKIDTAMDTEDSTKWSGRSEEPIGGAEVPMADMGARDEAVQTLPETE